MMAIPRSSEQMKKGKDGENKNNNNNNSRP